MAIYSVTQDRLVRLPALPFSESGLDEWERIKNLLHDHIDVIAPGTLVISPTYFRSASSSLGFLAVDEAANPVLIQLAKSQVGIQMELQALRLAMTTSSLTFSRTVRLFGDYLRSIESETNPMTALLDFLKWSEPNEEQFGQDVRIVLASAEFSSDVIPAVNWLSEHGLDIRCVRFKPYLTDRERILLEIQQVFPVPMERDFRGQLNDRQDAARSSQLTRYKVKVGQSEHEKLVNRWAIWHVLKGLVDAGVTPCLGQMVLRSSIIAKDGKLLTREPGMAGISETTVR